MTNIDQFSVCTIYRKEDAAKLPRMLESLPDEFEICLLLNSEVNGIGGDFIIEDRQGFKQSAWQYKKGEFSFAEARNKCMKLATRPWILMLDTDDILHYVRSDFEQVLALPEDCGAVACSVISHTPPENGSATGSIIPDIQYRLFRNKPEFEYKNRAHEQIIETVVNNGYRTAYSDIIIKHTGYFNASTDEMIGKLNRNLKYICADLANDINNNYLKSKALQTLNALRLAGDFS